MAWVAVTMVKLRIYRKGINTGANSVQQIKVVMFSDWVVLPYACDAYTQKITGLNQNQRSRKNQKPGNDQRHGKQPAIKKYPATRKKSARD